MDQGLFEEFEAKLAALEERDPLKIRRDVWLLRALGVGFAMTLLPRVMQRQEWAGWASLVGLTIELCAFGVLIWRQMRDAVPEFIHAKRRYASELDKGFVEHQRIRAWLKAIPLQQRQKRLAYIESRLESLGQRYPLLFGPTDKLGVLPGLVGLFLQVQALKSLSIATALLGGAVLGLYLMGLWMTRFRLQLQTYARYLKSVSEESGG